MKEIVQQEGPLHYLIGVKTMPEDLKLKILEVTDRLMNKSVDASEEIFVKECSEEVYDVIFGYCEINDLRPTDLDKVSFYDYSLGIAAAKYSRL